MKYAIIFDETIAIVVKSSTYGYDDETIRTVQKMIFTEYATREEWDAAIIKAMDYRYNKRKFRAITFNDATIKAEVSVTIDA